MRRSMKSIVYTIPPVPSTLVERFDIEPFSDSSAKRANFMGLVLFCIDAKFCKKVFVEKLLTRSTRLTCFCTARHSKFQPNLDKLFLHFYSFIPEISLNFSKKLSKNGQKSIGIDRHSMEFQQFLRKIPNSVRFFSNFLRFRNENCRFFQKMIFQKLETS